MPEKNSSSIAHSVSITAGASSWVTPIPFSLGGAAGAEFSIVKGGALFGGAMSFIAWGTDLYDKTTDEDGLTVVEALTSLRDLGKAAALTLLGILPFSPAVTLFALGASVGFGLYDWFNAQSAPTHRDPLVLDLNRDGKVGREIGRASCRERV